MNKKVSYGYVVALICFIIAFFYVGLAVNTGSLYVVPVTGFYDFSRAEFSIVFSIIYIITIFANLAFVKLYRILGIRKIVIMGAIFCASAFFVYYKATKLIDFYLGSFLHGMGYTYTNMLVFSILINSWFTENRGIVLGLISAGTGFGGSVMSPVMGYVISVYGFKQSYMLTFIILFILIIPIALFVKENPLEHYEDSIEEGLGKKRKTTGQVLKEKRVVLGFIVIFLMGFLISPWLNVLPSHLIDRGFDEIFASQILGGVFFIMALAKIFVGLIYDKIGIKAAIGVCLASFIISTILLFIVKSKIIAWLFAVLFGTSLSALSVLLPLFSSALAGEEYLSDIIGPASALVSAGISFGTPAINYTYDLTGSYNMILIISTILGVFNMVLTYIALSKKESRADMI